MTTHNNNGKNHSGFFCFLFASKLSVKQNSDYKFLFLVQNSIKSEREKEMDTSATYIYINVRVFSANKCVRKIVNYLSCVCVPLFTGVRMFLRDACLETI